MQTVFYEICKTSTDDFPLNSILRSFLLKLDYHFFLPYCVFSYIVCKSMDGHCLPSSANYATLAPARPRLLYTRGAFLAQNRFVFGHNSFFTRAVVFQKCRRKSGESIPVVKTYLGNIPTFVQVSYMLCSLH